MRKLTVKYTYDASDIYIHIAEQTHREDDFTPHGCRFKASNGWKLESRSVPELLTYDKQFYVRGDGPHRDTNSCYVGDPKHIFEINQAVREYNEKYGGHRV